MFLFTDLQIKDEAFMEDISMVLNTGEVPNLFQTEEKTEILERVQAHCQVATKYYHWLCKNEHSWKCEWIFLGLW